jgi:phosphoglycolate phosphatase
MIKLVAFDWNGTLLADTQTTVAACNFVFKHFGVKPISIHRYRETFEIPVSKFWINNGGKLEDLHKDKKQNEIFHDYYESVAASCRTRSGTKSLLKWLEDNNVEAIIYSNHTVSGITAQLKRLGIEKYITHVIARTDDEGGSHVHSRSKGTKLLDYIKKRKFKPGEVISVGDSAEEVEIGHDNGFHSVAITGGHSSVRRLRASKPNYLIHSMVALEKIIKKLNKKV